MRIASTYIQTYDEAQVRSGIKVLEDWLKAHSNNDLAATMWQYLGDTWFYPLKEYGKAVACYEHANDIGWVDRANKGGIYWRVASVADRYADYLRHFSDPAKAKQIAIKYYRKIIIETPQSGKAYESQLAMRRLGAEPPEINVFQYKKAEAK